MRRRLLAITMTGGLTLVMAPAASALATWTVVPSPNPASGDTLLLGADAISTTNVWAVGRSDGGTAPFRRTLTMRWNGSAWSVVPSPTPVDGGQLNDVDGTSATDVWAVGTHVQRWNGSAWNVVPSPSGFFGGVKTLSPAQAWAVGSSGGNTLTARWNGSAWSQVPSPSRPGTFNVLQAVDGASANDLWAVGHSIVDPGYGVEEALILRWNGSAWSIVPAPDRFAGLKGVVALAANDVWAVGERFSQQAVRFVPYAIHWNGTSWSRVEVPDPGVTAGSELNAVTALSPAKVYAVGQSGARPFITRWDGTRWTIEPTPSVTGPTLFGATSTGTGTVWGVGHRFTDIALRTLTVRTTNG
ncbi:hypothetical protein [Spirillospora sp. NPDC047279]|uniref:hypothetical protein n=1 Tax=Spirillospora sp. NPDC047279 TaxID=3155478 RepID=UPI0033E5D233